MQNQNPSSRVLSSAGGCRSEGAGGCSCPHHRVLRLDLAPHRFANGPAAVTHLSPPVWPHVPSPRASATFVTRCSRAGQAVTPGFLGSLAAMLMGGDGEEGPQAAPGDGVGEDRVTHRARPVPSQGGGDMGSLSLHPVPRDSAETSLGPSAASFHWHVFGRGGCLGVLVSPARGCHPSLSGDGWSAVVYRGCSQMPGTK